MAAQQKQRIAQLEAKQKLLNEAIYSGMNVRIDEASSVRHPAQSNRTVMNYGMRSNARSSQSGIEQPKPSILRAEQ